MKCFFIPFCAILLTACSAFIPYKDQNLDYLYGIEKEPTSYYGKVVAFEGEVKGFTEDTKRLHTIIKINAPLYYYAKGQGGPTAYELLLVSFDKSGIPQMSGIKKGHKIKVLARVDRYERRPNLMGVEISVLHLNAFAISNRKTKKDIFRLDSPEKELYKSWKSGRLFFNENPEDIIRRFSPKKKSVVPSQPEKQIEKKAPDSKAAPTEKTNTEQELIFEEHEDFVL